MRQDVVKENLIKNVRKELTSVNGSGGEGGRIAAAEWRGRSVRGMGSGFERGRFDI